MPSSRNAVLIVCFIGRAVPIVPVLIESVPIGPIAKSGAGSTTVGLLAWLGRWNFHRHPAVNTQHQLA
jgi:hypothetical protein